MYSKGSQARIIHLENLGWVYHPENEESHWYIKYNEDGRKVAVEGDRTWDEDSRRYQPAIGEAV